MIGFVARRSSTFSKGNNMIRRILSISSIAAIAILLAGVANSSHVYDPHEERALHIARGDVRGHEWIIKFGRNAAVTTQETIWTSGGDYTGFLGAGSQIEIVSSDLDDDDGDTGARSVTIEGLDVNFVFQTETLVMNGTTAVESVETDWRRVNRAYVETTGTRSATLPSTTGSNEGTITIRVQGAGAVLATIEQEIGKTEMAVFTIPAGKSGYLRRITYSVSATVNQTANLFFWRRNGADETAAPFSAKHMIKRFEDVSGAGSQDVEYGTVIPEKSDVWWSAVLSGSGSDAAVAVSFELVLVDGS